LGCPLMPTPANDHKCLEWPEKIRLRLPYKKL
jgi:hypothetical protein